jgi:cytoskeletal protein CcmA (bactofilin family)
MAMFGSSSRNAPSAAPPSDRPLTKNERSTDGSTTAASRGVLSSGVSIKGDLTFRNELLVDGEVEGKINATGALVVGKNARIKGEVRTKSLIVQGTIEGNVFASERCVLQAGSTLRGDIEAQRLAVDENASFHGSAKVTANRG